MYLSLEVVELSSAFEVDAAAPPRCDKTIGLLVTALLGVVALAPAFFELLWMVAMMWLIIAVYSRSLSSLSDEL